MDKFWENGELLHWCIQNIPPSHWCEWYGQIRFGSGMSPHKIQKRSLESISACYAQNCPILPEFLTAHGNARYTIHAQRTAFFLSTRCSQALRDFRRRMESGAIVGIGAAAAPSKPAGSAAPTERASTSIVTGAATAAGGSSPVVNTARTRITTAGAGPGPGPGPAA